MQSLRLRMLGAALTLALGVAGCTSTQIVNQWRNPSYVAPRFGKVLVVGVSRQPSIRRTFEDAFAARLGARGVNAEPSYRHIPEDGPVDEARLQEAVKNASADAVILTRLVRVERETVVTPGLYYPAPALTYGVYPGYYAAWLGHYEPPRVYQYDVYISETSLYDARDNQLVWTGTAQTRSSGVIDEEIEDYVEAVIKALAKANLLTGA